MATGCHKKAPIQHLPTETKVLPIKDHFDLKCSQYLAGSLRNSNISRETVLLPSGKRNMKQTLYSKYISTVEPHLQNGAILEISYKCVINSLHKAAVAATINKCVPNAVLGFRPPPIAD
jgi:hypothetical protein